MTKPTILGNELIATQRSAYDSKQSEKQESTVYRKIEQKLKQDNNAVDDFFN